MFLTSQWNSYLFCWMHTDGPSHIAETKPPTESEEFEYVKHNVQLRLSGLRRVERRKLSNFTANSAVATFRVNVKLCRLKKTIAFRHIVPCSLVVGAISQKAPHSPPREHEISRNIGGVVLRNICRCWVRTYHLCAKLVVRWLSMDRKLCSYSGAIRWARVLVHKHYGVNP
jgi:hypothetical protein